MSIYRAYLEKKAADEGFDPILQHPNLAAKPKGLDEMAERRTQLHIGASAGALLGAGAGVGAGLLLNKKMPVIREAYGSAAAPLYGALMGTAQGAAAGMGAARLPAFIDKLKRHDAAAQDYETRTGTKLPMDVRHPYAYNAAPMLAGMAAGAIAGPLIARQVNPGVAAHVGHKLLARGFGSAAGLVAGAVLTPGMAALGQMRRDSLLKNRVNSHTLENSVISEDELNEKALKST